MNTIRFFGNSDPGQLRSNNEDAFIAQYIWDKKHILAVAIDGVGGYEGGEIASSLAQKCIVEYLERYSDGERLELLKQAVLSANNTIFSERKNQVQYCNMSCVLTAVLIEVENKVINMAHIGDTRLYQYSNGKIVKLSHDHSLVGYREEMGELTEEEAMKHPQRNVIGRDAGSQFLESTENDYIEVATFSLLPNSTLLLCSDGLCDMITSKQMCTELEKEYPVEEKVAGLIKAANAAGGKDNITVVLVESNDPDAITIEERTEETITEEDSKMEEESASVQEERHTCLWLFAGIVAIFAVIAGYLLGGFTAQKTFPSVFLLYTDSAYIHSLDSVNNILKEDTAELKKRIKDITARLDSLKANNSDDNQNNNQ